MKDGITEPETLFWLGNSYKTILDADDTDGRLSIADTVSPAGSGPPRHVHDDADETFVVLSGDVTFWMEGKMFSRGPGQTAFIPRGTEHTFRVTDDGPSRHLVILSPGEFDRFFAEMARGDYAIPDDMEAITEIAARYHLRFTGPPLTAEEAKE